MLRDEIAPLQHEVEPDPAPPEAEVLSVNEPGASLTAPWSAGYRPQERPLDCHQHHDYSVGMYRHPFTEVALVISGRGKVRVGDRLTTTGPGDLHVVPPGVAHGYDSLRKLDLYHLELPPSFLQRHAPVLHVLPGFSMLFTVEPFFRVSTGFRHGLKLAAENHRHVVRLFQLLQAESLRPPAAGLFALDTLGLYVLATLCRLYSEQLPRDEGQFVLPPPTQAFAEVFRLVAEHYREKLLLGDLAEAAHMHRSHFCRLFHRVMAVTPMEYVAQYRVQMGRLLLWETNQSVTEIAHAVGFYDTSHFCRTFARVLGMSPTAYRQSIPVTDAFLGMWDVVPHPAGPPLVHPRRGSGT